MRAIHIVLELRELPYAWKPLITKVPFRGIGELQGAGWLIGRAEVEMLASRVAKADLLRKRDSKTKKIKASI